MLENFQCRECGVTYHALTSQHIVSHDMSVRQYLEKHRTQEIVWPNTGNDKWSKLNSFVIKNDGCLLLAQDIYARMSLRHDDIGFKSTKSLARGMKTMGLKFIRPGSTAPLIWKMEARISEGFLEKRKKAYK